MFRAIVNTFHGQIYIYPIYSYNLKLLILAYTFRVLTFCYSCLNSFVLVALFPALSKDRVTCSLKPN